MQVNGSGGAGAGAGAVHCTVRDVEKRAANGSSQEAARCGAGLLATFHTVRLGTVPLVWFWALADN